MCAFLCRDLQICWYLISFVCFPADRITAINLKTSNFITHKYTANGFIRGIIRQQMINFPLRYNNFQESHYYLREAIITLFIITKGIMFAGFTITWLYCDYFNVINLSHYTGVAFVKGRQQVFFIQVTFFTLGTASQLNSCKCTEILTSFKID